MGIITDAMNNDPVAGLQAPALPAVPGGDATATTSSAPAVPVPTVSTYNPTLTGVGKDETVSGQLDKILGSGSPLLERARAGATATANSRGLINSSMAAGAGEAAVIDAALPIAAQDAQTNWNSTTLNQTAKNQAGQFNATASNALNLQVLKGDQAQRITTIDNEYKNLLQTNTLAANLYGGSLNAMTAIATSSTMDSASKQVALDNMTLWLDAGLGLVGGISGYDLRSLLTFQG